MFAATSMHGKRKLINMGEKDANSILLGIPEIKKYEKNFPMPRNEEALQQERVLEDRHG